MAAVLSWLVLNPGCELVGEYDTQAEALVEAKRVANDYDADCYIARLVETIKPN